MLEWQAAGKGEFMQVSGLRYTYDPRLPMGSRVVASSVNGSPLVPAQLYKVATNNYVAGHLPELLGIAPSPDCIQELAITDRTMYIEYIQRVSRVRSHIDGRIVNLESPEPKFDKID
jgi:2',3'-cyclic-nucleotide 2'-phosphodiesterase (5'-nucleotidase family)